MKKVYLISVILLVIGSINSVNAQIEKNTWLIGASSNLQFQYWQEDDASKTNINLAPRFGYFIKNNLLVGVEIPFNYSYSINRYTDPRWSSSIVERLLINLNPFARYYFGESNFKSYLHASAGLGYRKSFIQNPDDRKTRGSYSIFNYAVGSGISYMVKSKVIFELQANYRYQYQDNEDETFEFKEKGFQVLLGINFIL